MQKCFIVSVLNELALISHPSKTCCVCFYNKKLNKNLLDFVLFFCLSLATPPLFITTNLSHPLISFPYIPTPSWAAFQLTVYIIPMSLPFIYVFFFSHCLHGKNQQQQLIRNRNIGLTFEII